MQTSETETTSDVSLRTRPSEDHSADIYDDTTLHTTALAENDLVNIDEDNRSDSDFVHSLEEKRCVHRAETWFSQEQMLPDQTASTWYPSTLTARDR